MLQSYQAMVHARHCALDPKLAILAPALNFFDLSLRLRSDTVLVEFVTP